MSTNPHQTEFLKGIKLSFGEIENIIIKDKEGNLHNFEDLEDNDFNKFMSSVYIRLYAFYREKLMPKLMLKKANMILESDITKTLDKEEAALAIVIPIKKTERTKKNGKI